MRKKKLMTQVTFGDCSWINMYRANSMQINLPFISPSVLNNSYILQDSIISASLLTSCVALVFLLSKPHFPYLQFFFSANLKSLNSHLESLQVIAEVLIYESQCLIWWGPCLYSFLMNGLHIYSGVLWLVLL